MSPDFLTPVVRISQWLKDRPVDDHLQDALSAAFPLAGSDFQDLAAACRLGVEQGWLASRGEEPLKWGRVIKPGDDTCGFSVDVVRMSDVAGPHHAHPNGEIDMIIPLAEGARFDGHGQGWLVYPPGSAHRPTVTGGSAIIVYFLPQGAIEFGAA